MKALCFNSELCTPESRLFLESEPWPAPGSITKRVRHILYSYHLLTIFSENRDVVVNELENAKQKVQQLETEKLKLLKEVPHC